jgi:hypothetical protein
MDITYITDWIIPIAKIINPIAIFFIGYLLAARARKIQTLMAWNSYREPIRKFADEVIEVLSKVEGLCETNPKIKQQDFWDKYNEYLTEISCLRDKGKLLLPNHFPNSYGTTKSSAYRGIRQSALDCLKAAFYITAAINFKEFANNKVETCLQDEHLEKNVQLKKLKAALSELPEGFKIEGHDNKGWSCKSGIVEAKRQFVSECQNLIDPEEWNKEIIDVVDKH